MAIARPVRPRNIIAGWPFIKRKAEGQREIAAENLLSRLILGRGLARITREQAVGRPRGLHATMRSLSQAVASELDGAAFRDASMTAVTYHRHRDRTLAGCNFGAGGGIAASPCRPRIMISVLSGFRLTM